MRTILIIVFLLLGANSGFAQDENALSRRLDQQSEVAIHVDLYPNPAVDNLNVRLKGDHTAVEFEMHNIIGNKIRVEPEKLDDHNYRIRVEDLSPGYYLLSVKDKNRNFNKIYKFLKR